MARRGLAGHYRLDGRAESGEQIVPDPFSDGGFVRPFKVLARCAIKCSEDARDRSLSRCSGAFGKERRSVGGGRQVARAAEADVVRARVRVGRAAPRQLRHFRFPPQVDFSITADGRRSLLGLVCPDRPGLLADVAQALRDCRLRVHDARIATFGERAEDLFQITDEHDQPLDATAQDCLRETLRVRLDRDGREPDSLNTGVPR